MIFYIRTILVVFLTILGGSHMFACGQFHKDEELFMASQSAPTPEFSVSAILGGNLFLCALGVLLIASLFVLAIRIRKFKKRFSSKE